MENLYHWYHVYADGCWQPMLEEHIWSLRHYGLYENLTSMFVGFVGSDSRIAEVKEFLDSDNVKYETCGTAPSGWEQVTLSHMWEFAKDHDGLCVYTHTKGASKGTDHMFSTWRRGMQWYTICQWKDAVDRLSNGARIAGPHWIPLSHTGAEHHHYHHFPPPSGIFGGNFWWSSLKEIRDGEAPDQDSRFCAEHWITQRERPLGPGEIAHLGENAASIFSYPHEALSWWPPTP